MIEYIPYSDKHKAGCVEVLKYLWKENEKERLEHFEWAYYQNPTSKPLAIVAVEEERVVGFRGFMIDSICINGEESLVGKFADTVVDHNYRRRGIFAGMTKASLSYLNKNGVSLIINLTPSWPPYYGYIKIGFRDLINFRSLYYFNLISIIKLKLSSKYNSLKRKTVPIDINIKEENRIIYIRESLDEVILEKFAAIKSKNNIHFPLSIESMGWKMNRPNKKYIFMYTLDENQNLLNFFCIRNNNNFNFEIGVFESVDNKSTKEAFKVFKQKMQPAAIAFWDFAVPQNKRSQLRKIGFITIPFLNKVRKNPPLIIRPTDESLVEQESWCINGIDILKISNWDLNKIDSDVF